MKKVESISISKSLNLEEMETEEEEEEEKEISSSFKNIEKIRNKIISQFFCSCSEPFSFQEAKFIGQNSEHFLNFVSSLTGHLYWNHREALFSLIEILKLPYQDYSKLFHSLPITMKKKLLIILFHQVHILKLDEIIVSSLIENNQTKDIWTFDPILYTCTLSKNEKNLYNFQSNEYLTLKNGFSQTKNHILEWKQINFSNQNNKEEEIKEKNEGPNKKRNVSGIEIESPSKKMKVSQNMVSAQNDEKIKQNSALDNSGTVPISLDSTTRTLINSFKEKIIKLTESRSTSTNRFLPEDFIKFLSEAPNIGLVCQELRIPDLPDELFFEICNKWLTPDIGFYRCVEWMKFVLLPKIIKLQNPASRLLFSSIMLSAKMHPKPIIYGVLLPLIFNTKLLTSHVEVINRVIKDCLPQEFVIQFLNGILRNTEEEINLFFEITESSNPWNEMTISIINDTLANQKLALPDFVLESLIKKLAIEVDQFSKSLKFSNLCLTLATRYSKQLLPVSDSFKTLVAKTDTYLKKTILSKLS